MGDTNSEDEQATLNQAPPDTENEVSAPKDTEHAQSASHGHGDKAEDAKALGNLPTVPIATLLLGGSALALLSFFGTILAIEISHRTGPLALGPTAFLLGSDSDGPGTVVHVPGPRTVQQTIVHSVFFENGSHQLSPEGEKNLGLIRAQLTCGAPEVKITSWVSSRKYVNDPQQSKNVQLAADRAEEVERRLAGPKLKVVFARKKWMSYQEILDQHWFTEVDPLGKTDVRLESLNRRVDVEVTSPCRKPTRPPD